MLRQRHHDEPRAAHTDGCCGLRLRVIGRCSLLWLFDGDENEEEYLHAISAFVKSGACRTVTKAHWATRLTECARCSPRLFLNSFISGALGRERRPARLDARGRSVAAVPAHTQRVPPCRAGAGTPHAIFPAGPVPVAGRLQRPALAGYARMHVARPGVARAGMVCFVQLHSSSFFFLLYKSLVLFFGL